MHYFTAKWQVGRPWLVYANGVMWYVACQACPQPGPSAPPSDFVVPRQLGTLCRGLMEHLKNISPTALCLLCIPGNGIEYGHADRNMRE